jgi:hypothetical protein
MKTKTNLLLATAVLAGSVLASAQMTTPGAEDATHPDNMTAPLANGGGTYEATISGTAQPNQDNAFRDQSNRDTSNRNDNQQIAPDDPQKNPYWEPRDWNYIRNDAGGS